MSAVRRWSVHSWLAALVLACVLPMSLAAGLAVSYAYDYKNELVGGHMTGTARAISMSVERELANALHALQALATSPSLAARDFAAFHRQAREVVAGFEGADIILAEAGGQQLVNTYRDFGEPLPKRNSSGIQVVFNERRPVISDVFQGAVTRRFLIGIDIPVIISGDVVYDLAMTLPADRLAAILTEQRLPPGWTGSILDGGNVIAARTKDPEHFVGRSIGPALAAELAKKSEGLATVPNIAGERVIAAFYRSKAGWTIVVGVPAALIQTEIQLGLAWGVGAVCLLLVLGIVVAAIIGAHIARSIGALKATALALGRGEAVVLPPLRLRETDEVGQALLNASDLLARRAAERRRVERQLKLAIRGGNLATWDWSIPDGGIIVNVRWWEMLGLTPDEMTSSLAEWEKRVHPDDIARVKQILAVHLQGETDFYREEYRLRHKQGQWIWVLDAGCVYERGADNRPLRAAGIRIDITERKKAQLDLEVSNAELQQFAYVVSHDLRAPLRTVNSFLTLLQRRLGPSLDEDCREFIDFAVAGARRMDALIIGLLEYSRVGRHQEMAELVPLADVVKEAFADLSENIAASGAVIEVMEGLPRLRGHRMELVRLFENLIGNALKYTVPGRPARLAIAWRDEGDKWVVSVQDNGIGIAPEHHDKVFGIFQRLVTDKEYEGTGIGLAICRKIVGQHGGQIWIDSRLGEGSCFLMSFPKVTETPAETPA